MGDELDYVSRPSKERTDYFYFSQPQKKGNEKLKSRSTENEYSIRWIYVLDKVEPINHLRIFSFTGTNRLRGRRNSASSMAEHFARI